MKDVENAHGSVDTTFQCPQSGVKSHSIHYGGRKLRLCLLWLNAFHGSTVKQPATVNA